MNSGHTANLLQNSFASRAGTVAPVPTSASTASALCSDGLLHALTKVIRMASIPDRDLFEFLEHTTDAAFTVTDAGEICSWNTLLGFGRDEVSGKTCFERRPRRLIQWQCQRPGGI